jgi:hypothetical protein
VNDEVRFLIGRGNRESACHAGQRS